MGAVVLLISGLVKILVDKGILTDQELQVYLHGMAADTYQNEPLAPIGVTPGVVVQAASAQAQGTAPDATGTAGP